MPAASFLFKLSLCFVGFPSHGLYRFEVKPQRREVRSVGHESRGEIVAVIQCVQVE